MRTITAVNMPMRNTARSIKPVNFTATRIGLALRDVATFTSSGEFDSLAMPGTNSRLYPLLSAQAERAAHPHWNSTCSRLVTGIQIRCGPRCVAIPPSHHPSSRLAHHLSYGVLPVSVLSIRAWISGILTLIGICTPLAAWAEQDLTTAKWLPSTAY